MMIDIYTLHVAVHYYLFVYTSFGNIQVNQNQNHC